MASSEIAGQAVPAPVIGHGETGEDQGIEAVSHPELERQNSQNSSGGFSSPGSPDPVHDLPMELLQAGWRKFWSKRENRPYYFNKLTNQSLWEMPPLPSQVSWKSLFVYLNTMDRYCQNPPMMGNNTVTYPWKMVIG